MSVQTLSDIIVSQQVKTSELQTSGQTQISPKKSESSSSFADLVSFFKGESKSDTVSAEKQEIKTEDSDKSQSSNVKDQKSDDSSTKQVEKTDSSEKSDKTENIKETDSKDKSEKIEEKKDSVKSKEKAETKSKKSDEKTIKSEESKENKEEKSENFSRIDELVSFEKSVNVESADVAKDADNKKEDLKIDAENDVKGKTETVDNQILQVAENLNQTEQSKNQNSELDEKDFTEDFDFGEKKSSKTVALDKDGKITVEDLRTKNDAEVEKTEKNQPKLKTELKINNENTATITMEYANKADADVLSLNNQTAASNGSTYQQMLNNQVQMNVPEFVKAGNIVLKDNNQGSINLVLHPDDLGNVKIRLSLDGKTVTGHITVASKEALEVFKDNAETLREAFIKSGFDGANFDVAYGGNNSNFGENAEFQRNDGTDIFGRKMYGNVAGNSNDYIDSGEYSENIVNSENFSINIVA